MRAVAPHRPLQAPRLAWLCVAALLVANIPLILCMPLAADAVLYDLQAKTALTGGLLYRDIVEPNLPGIVWCHMTIRSLFGWSELALRLVDLAIVGGIVTLLSRWITKRHPASRTVSTVIAGFVFTACGFYFSTPEWVHCQRDIWLMLPALAAFTLRTRRIALACGEASFRHTFLPALLEGLLWASAFWIKPYVAFPALAAIAMSFAFLRARVTHPVRWMAVDLAGVLTGGLLVGTAGATWLIATGVWPHFWEMALQWNPMYFANGRARWTIAQYLSLSRDLAPWCFIHLAAIPVALWQIANVFRCSNTGAIGLLEASAKRCQHVPPILLPAHDSLSAGNDPAGRRWPTGRMRGQTTVPESNSLDLRPLTPLLAALYLGWLFQAHFLQHPFHYAHVPGIFLAAALLAACWPNTLRLRRAANFGFAALLLAATTCAPCFDPARLAWWPECMTRGSTPEVKCALHHRNLPNWVELQPVIEFLKQQDLHDGELTAYNVFLVHLYPEVGVRPSTRYVFLDVLMQVFHDREALIHQTLAESKQRFVVCSLLENGLSAADIAADGPGVKDSLPAKFPAEHQGEFPYCLPMVFRSGQYVVYRVDGSLGPLNTRPRPLAGPAKSPGRGDAKLMTRAGG